MRDSPEPTRGQSFGFADDPESESGSVVVEALDLRVQVTDPEVVAELQAQPTAEARAELARDALRLGVLALKGARGQADVETDPETPDLESDRLLGELERNLESQQVENSHQLTALLREYLDPTSGKLSKGVEKADDLLASISDLVQQSLDLQRERILEEFSLDNADGALARLVREVGDHRETLGRTLDERIGEVAREFSLDDEESPLSRLVQRVEFTQQQLYDEFSLDESASSLGRVRAELLSALATQKEETGDFQREVRRTLAGMAGTTAAGVRVVRDVDDFQDELHAFFTRQGHRLGDVVEKTSDSSGRVRGSKKGRFVIELGADCAAAATRIVVDADPDASFTLAGALDELEEARENRDAGVGLFVFPRQDYPEGLPPLERHGNDVVAIWDVEDATSDIFLEGALMVARALCVRASTTRDAELESLDAILLSIHEVQRQASGLDEIERLTASVRVNADKVLKRAMTMRDGLTGEFDALQRRVEELRHRIGS